MSSNVDVQGALALLYEIGPTLADEERVLRAAESALLPAEVLDRALRGALARHRVEVSRETFVYLEWHVTRARRDAPGAGALPETARGRPNAELPTDRPTRLVCDPAGRRWAVREVGPNDLFGGESPRWLTFRSAGAERRTSAYPPDWESLSAAALLALLALLPHADADPRPRATR
jgi:hypothetical protein